MKRLFWGLFVVLLGGYLALALYFRHAETSLLYHPGSTGAKLRDPPAELALPIQRVSFPSSDSVTLVGWTIRADSAVESGVWILHLHGNAGDIAYGGRPRYYALTRNTGANQLTFDYRGFGESEGEISEQGLYDDAHAAYKYLRESLRVPPNRIVIYGHSLGSAVAIELASQVEAAGIIVEGAMTSVPERAQEIYPFLPVRLIARNRFESIERIEHVRMSKLFMHATDDITIPISHGRRLFDRATEPKRFVELRGGHNDAYDEDADHYFAEVAAFVRSVAPGAVHDAFPLPMIASPPIRSTSAR